MIQIVATFSPGRYRIRALVTHFGRCKGGCWCSSIGPYCCLVRYLASALRFYLLHHLLKEQRLDCHLSNPSPTSTHNSPSSHNQIDNMVVAPHAPTPKIKQDLHHSAHTCHSAPCDSSHNIRHTYRTTMQYCFVFLVCTPFISFYKLFSLPSHFFGLEMVGLAISRQDTRHSGWISTLPYTLSNFNRGLLHIISRIYEYTRSDISTRFRLYFALCIFDSSVLHRVVFISRACL